MSSHRVSEVEPDLPGHRARRDVVRAAERGEEVVKSDLVHHIDGGDLEAPFIAVTVKQVIVARTQIKQAAGADALGVVVVIFSPGCRYSEVCGSQPGCIAHRKCRPCRAWSSKRAIASEASLKLLIGSQEPSSDCVREQDLATYERSIGAWDIFIRPSVRKRRRERACSGWRGARYGAADQPAVISPVERDPRQLLP